MGMVVGNTGMVSMEAAYYDPENDELGNTDQPTFEELCRAHINAFVQESAKYIMQNDLYTRVGTWHEKLGPMLQENENRPEFNIIEYNKKLVKSVVDEKKYQAEERRKSRLSLEENLKVKETIVVLTYIYCVTMSSLLYLLMYR